MRTKRRFGLAPFLGGALLLHGVAGLLWPAMPMPAGLPGKPPLQARLRPAERSPDAAIPAPRATPHAQTDNPMDSRSRRRPEITGKMPETPISAAIPAAPSPLGGKLAEEAKAMLNRESRQRQLDPMFAPPGKAAAVDSPLARATARPQAGEKMLGDGVLQLTTADGKVHCLQKPSDIASRDIPGGSFAIPVTCPF